NVDHWGGTVFRVGKGRDAASDEYKLVRDILDDVEGLRTSGLTRCQEEKCMSISVHVCGANLATISNSLLMRATEQGLADIRFNLRVNAVGPLAPRCSSDAPDCGPVPYAALQQQQRSTGS